MLPRRFLLSRNYISLFLLLSLDERYGLPLHRLDYIPDVCREHRH